MKQFSINFLFINSFHLMKLLNIRQKKVFSFFEIESRLFFFYFHNFDCLGLVTFWGGIGFFLEFSVSGFSADCLIPSSDSSRFSRGHLRLDLMGGQSTAFHPSPLKL